MSLHTELSIYKLAFDLLELSVVCMGNMRRDFKQSLGRRIHDECIEILILVARANAILTRERAAVVDQMLVRVDTVKFLMRVAAESKFKLIDPGLWSKAIALLESLGAQGGGWKRDALTRKTAVA